MNEYSAWLTELWIWVSAEGERANFRSEEWENEDWKAQQDTRETRQHSDAMEGNARSFPL